MLQKARQPKHGGNKPILQRWHKDEQYRKSLSEIGWTEDQIIEYGKIALEDHSYVDTKPERVPDAKQWVLRLNNQDGAQQPQNQRPDFGSSKTRMQNNTRRTCEKDSTRKKTNLRDQQSRQRRGQASEGIDEHDYRVDPGTGWRSLSQSHRETCRIRPGQQNWDRNKWTTRSWNSWRSSRSENSRIFF